MAKRRGWLLLLLLFLLAGCNNVLGEPRPGATPTNTLDPYDNPPVPIEMRLPLAWEVPTPVPGLLKPVRKSATLPPGPVTIVCLGDSLTQGEGDDLDQGGYPGRLKKLVDAIRPGSRVVNLGKSGWTSTQMVEGELPVALDAKPQIALIWTGSNDLWYNLADDDATDLGRFKHNIEITLARLSDQGVRSYVALLDDQSKRPVATTGVAGNFSPADLQRMSRRVYQYNAIIDSLVPLAGALTVDLFNSPVFTGDTTLAPDGNHPNSTGYDIIARKWFEAIEPALGR